jgi:hypothetical protein
VTLARPDHELPSAIFADFAYERVIEKTVPQSLNDEPFNPIERVTKLSAIGAVLDGGGGHITHREAAFMSLIAKME